MGHGKSEPSKDGYSYVKFAKDVTAFLINIIKRPVLLFGHSLGGAVAVHVAATHPDIVSALILS